MNDVKWTDRLRYRFDNFMSRGTGALIGALFLVTALMVGAGSLIFFLGRVRQEGAAAGLSLSESFWQSMVRALDPGTMAGDMGWSFRIVAFAITMGGIFITSALIGVLASGLDERLNQLRRGRSRVIEEGHTVILGWSPQVFTIVSELALANRNLRKARSKGRSACVAILADKDKVEMEDEIRAKVLDTKGTRVVCRTANSLDADDLKIVSPETARAIMIVSPGGPYPDLPIAGAMMALAKGRDRRQKPYHIVAALHRPSNMQIIRMIGGDEAAVFLVDGLISRLIAQTCRQSGLSAVYGELLSFEGAAIYFQEEPALVGKTYGEALLCYEDSAMLGLQHDDGQVVVCPPMDTPIVAGDKVIAISADDDSVILSDMAAIHVDAGAIRNRRSLSYPPERLLILGWNRRGPMILEQLAHYVAPGSQIVVVAALEPAQMQADCAHVHFQNMRATFLKGNPFDRGMLERLVDEGHQYMIILSPSDTMELRIADAACIVTLLHLRDIAARTGRRFSIVSEILDARSRDLAEVTSADDVIVSERLIALAMTQIAENKDLLPVFGEFLSAEGPDIYLKPAQDYVVLDRPVSFYTVVEAARRRGETAIGYRLLSEASDPGQAYGVHMNPVKSAPIRFGENDRIVVLAESER